MKITNNEQRTNDGKQKRCFIVAKIFVIFTLITLMFNFSACQDTFTVLQQEDVKSETGWFSLTLGEPISARTIMPSTVLNDFAVYTLEFFIANTNTLIFPAIDRNNENLPEPIQLYAGTWDLHVNAYMDIGKTKLAAQGELKGIVIGGGGTTARNIMLAPISDGINKGIFNWDINYPSNVTDASMTITKLPISTETQHMTQTIPLIDPGHQIGSIELYTGFYRILFKLQNEDGFSTERWETLHIYQNMESAFDFTFTEKQFTNILPTPGLAYTYSYYTESYSVSRGTATAANVVIPPTYNNLPVTTLADGSFQGYTDMISIYIPDSVTSIYTGAFVGCTNLESITIPFGASCIPSSIRSSIKTVVITGGNSIAQSAFNNFINLTNITIPDSVTSIGYGAFWGCSSLTSITIPDSVISIGERAFYDCRNLSVIAIPDSVTSIGAQAFSYCYSLTSIIIPSSVTTIGSSVFSSCSNLTSITISEGVTNIGDGMFASCYNLPSIVIPSSVTSIGSSAFSYCYGLTSITIPSSVTSIGNNAFLDCKLSSITVDSANQYHFTQDGILYSKTEILYVSNGISGSIIIPFGVTSIGSNAFSSCSSLTSITIPSSVTSIGNYAFSSCRSLTSIIIPFGVTSIGNYAFSSCSSLTSITIPSSVTSIGNYAFNSCNELTKVYYGGANLEAWNEINIGSSNTPLVNATRYYYSETYPGVLNAHWRFVDGVPMVWDTAYSISLTPSSNHAFPVALVGYGVQNTHNVTVNNSGDAPTGVLSVTLSGTNASNFTVSTTTLSSIAVGGSNSFTVRPNTGLAVGIYTATVTVAGSNSMRASFNVSFIVDQVGTSGLAFTLNSDGTAYSVSRGSGSILTSQVIIPATHNGLMVTAIDDNGFSQLTNMTSISIPNSITSIGNQAFRWCSNLTSINIPSSVTSIGTEAFSGCGKLSSITVASGNTVYRSEGNCLIQISNNTLIAGLKNSVIPNNVTSIGTRAFASCNGLTSINIPNSVTSIGQYAFNGCSDLISVAIGNSVTYIGSFAFSGCTSLTNITIPNSVTSIGQNAFSGSGLTSVTIPGSLSGANSFSSNVFSSCDNLTNVVIEDGVTSIGFDMFTSCKNLTSVTIPNSVRTISDRAFYYCGSLTSITIPSSVTSIGADAFRGSSAFLEKVFYGGADITAWNRMNIYSGNSNLTNAMRYYYSETQPDTDNTHWRFIGGVPTVWERNPYSIALTPASNYSFPSAGVNYDTQNALSVTVNNDGIMATGSLIIMLSGTNASNFTLSATSISSIATGGNNSFTVRPNNGLPVGTYTATVTVSGSNVTSRSFNVGFAVNQAYYSIFHYPQTYHHTFPVATVGYGTQTAHDVIVINNGNQPTGVLSVVLSGTNASSFTLSTTSINNIVNGGNTSFTVRPNNGLLEGTYTATVTVSGNNNLKTSFDVSFTVISNPNTGTTGLSYTLINNGTAYSVSRGTATATTVVIPATYNGRPVLTIANDGFTGYSTMTSIIIPNGVEGIGYQSFINCHALTSIVIPSSVTIIGNSVFAGCYNIRQVFYGGANNTAWNNITMGSNPDLTNAVRYFYSVTQPSTGNTHWRFVDGIPVIW